MRMYSQLSNVTFSGQNPASIDKYPAMASYYDPLFDGMRSSRSTMKELWRSKTIDMQRYLVWRKKSASRARLSRDMDRGFPHGITVERELSWIVTKDLSCILLELGLARHR